MRRVRRTRAVVLAGVVFIGIWFAIVMILIGTSLSGR